MVPVLSLDGSLSSLLQSPPSLLWKVTVPPLKNIAFFQQPPQFKYVDFNVEFINVMPFNRYY